MKDNILIYGNAAAMDNPKMKEKELKFSKVLNKIFIHIGYFIVGLFAARGSIFGGYLPFGAAYISAVPIEMLLASTLGTFLGCFFPFAIKDSIRYIAAILAVAAIRWTLSELRNIRDHPLFSPVVSMVPLIATGLALVSVKGNFMTPDMIMYITEAMIASGAAFFFKSTVTVINSNRGITTLNHQELACVVLTFCMILLTFSGIEISGISVGRILAILTILFCSYYGGVEGGCISGIATGVVLSLSSSSITYISGAYAFGGLIGGLFSQIGKFATIIAFILVNAVVSLQTGNITVVITGLYEVMAATFIFFGLPKDVGNKFKKLFKTEVDLSNSEGVRKSAVMRMDFAAKTLCSVSDCIDAVSKKLKNLNITDINGVYQKTADSVCRKCGLKTLCWEQNYDNTMRAFNDVTHILRDNGRVVPEDFPEHFSKRCSRIVEVSNNVSNYYNDYIATASAQRRVNEVRSVVYDQFYGMSEILNDMAQELDMYKEYDSVTGQQITDLFKELGLNPKEVSCRLDKLDRMSIEAEVLKEDASKIFNKSVLKEIDKICDRRMDKPSIISAKECSRIQISEIPSFEVGVGVTQHICNDGRLCGDSYSYFNDGMGRMVFIISDGMGTGGRAAVDGAMASGIMTRLAKSGISFECALRIVNSALLVKSDEESLSTLDILRFDMFSGKVEFLKAGAPVTFIRKRGRVIRVDAPSLPAGILTEISFSKESSELESGDCILMISDGMTVCGDSWLEKELEKWNEEGEKEFVKRLVKQAQFRRTDGRDDDITAIAIKIA